MVRDKSEAQGCAKCETALTNKKISTELKKQQ